MQPVTLSPEMIAAEVFFALIVLLFIGLIAGAIFSIISEYKADAKSELKTNRNSERR